MSKLLENKQIIHIATEIIVLIGITFYFSSKNRKLSAHIEDLSQRLEDQEDLIQKHEQIIRQLVQAVNAGSGKQKPQPTVSENTHTKPVKSKKYNHNPKQSTYTEEVVGNTVEYLSENDSDLDNEIAEELKELKELEKSDKSEELEELVESEELEELQQDGLKKRS